MDIDLEIIIKDLVEGMKNPTKVTLDTASIDLAKRTFRHIQNLKTQPGTETVLYLLIKNGCPEKEANYLVKRFKKLIM